MKATIRGNGSSQNITVILARAFMVAGFFVYAGNGLAADLSPGDGSSGPTNTPLDSWSFQDHTSWTDDAGNAPMSFTNLAFSHLGDGTSLVVDTNVPAWLQYYVYEPTNAATNLTVNTGSVTFWFGPDWASTNAGGTGPGEWGRLFEVGSYTPDSSYGWWSIFVDNGGNNIYFAAQTNDLSSNVTTYVSVPISWKTNYFHFIALTYSPSNTALYLDGVLATNGPGVTVYPGPEVLTNGFYLGSDSNGVLQARGLFNTVATYNYPLNSNDVRTIFNWYYPFYIIDPYNTAYMDLNSSQNISFYSTNLALSPVSISNNFASLFVVNSGADILYEIQGTTNLAHPNWISYGFVNGSELTNWTPTSVLVGKTGAIFLRIRSWQDSTGTGIPDWWWLMYFGQITNVDAYADPMQDGWSNLEKFQLGLNPTNFCTPPPPTGVYAYLDSTGTNMLISWNPSPGPVTNYIIYSSVYDWMTGGYDHVQIGSVNGSANSFTVVGAVQDGFYVYDAFAVQAGYSGGMSSLSGDANISSGPPGSSSFNYNIYITAYLIRNATGRWQIMFSGFPTNSAQTIQLAWRDGNWNFTTQNISTTNLINGVYAISDTNVVNFLGDTLFVQLFGPNGEPGQVAQAGVLSSDAPYFVDGRQHMKQNLIFMIRGASDFQPFFAEITEFRDFYGGAFYDSLVGEMNQSATNFEEFSFLRHDSWNDGAWEYLDGFSLDNLWPFTVNYDLANYFVDTSRTSGLPFGSTNFVFQPNFATNIPAPAILTHADPYWILQPSFYANGDNPSLDTTSNWNVTVTSTQTVASFTSGGYNFFGLPYQTGCEVDMGTGCLYQALAPGGSVTANQGYLIGGYANWCPAPTLQLVNYYFVPLLNPGPSSAGLPGVGAFSPVQQPFPVPIIDSFNVTNQTPPLIVGTIGQPMILGGWAKYAIQESGSTKFAYLGQYFNTNSFLLNANGTATTNSAGILSPYGEFFPTQAGVAALVTMPDIDPPYQQGTGVVRVISLNADANHDGTLDFSYFGPDQTSPSRPFHFWVNDCNDAGDDGGDGIPGQTGCMADGQNFEYWDWYQNIYIYKTQGVRNLINFFPVYLNIGSLFQSNTLSAGISVTDTNYHFRLKQADGALRFAYTGLTPTNYMDYLLKTNVASSLDSMPLTTITATGVDLTASFLNQLATANRGIIIVEAWTNTTSPLVLEISQGTNLLAQTSLYLSISGVEQMFRHKNLMLNGTGLADRLTDASVPNEPDTIAKNFVFLHGYNVLPKEARGVAADMFKRMYWSGSHAKFYAVTWQGADTKGTFPFYNKLTPNYHTNVGNAFLTAPLLANFIATLTNTGPVVASAHSLGNMVTLSAISDWNAPISQYFMLDAAVPIEAIDPAATTNMMIFSTWIGYTNLLFASDWYQLFPTNDARSTLFWNNRLGDLRNVDVYNFYSSGEEILRTYTNDPPPSVLNKVWTQVTDFWPFGIPFGSYTWYWQEKGKGTCSQDWFLGSTHGGWKFNLAYETNFVTGAMLAPPLANLLPNSQLQTNAFFDLASTGYGSPDLALYGTSGSAYAQANRNRILSDAIPAMSVVAGANPVPKLKPQNGDDHNLDMNTLQFQNSWPQGRTGGEQNKWHHSDFHEVAYTFTYKLFNQFVTTGNLK